MLSFLTVAALSVIPTAFACGDHPEHVHRAGGTPSTMLTPPSRPLEWGDINILHTTDSHGWLLGHQKETFPEPNYSGDLGEFSSFVTRMKAIADEKNVDLLLVDSGDLHDGTGLVDGPPDAMAGHDAIAFLQMLPYDVMAIGNHELYAYANAFDMHKSFAPKLNGRYLTSNANITVADDQGNPVSVPIGDRFAKFRTHKGRSVTALGVLFDFKGNSKNTTMQPVSEMVKEQWFSDAISDEPDLFLLAGHMPVSRDKWPIVFDAIRAVHPLTPIIILGGHEHIRDCVQLDGRSMSLASGHYMETIGWMSVKLDEWGSKDDIKFSRRYLDANRVTYQFHTGHSDATFDTFEGLMISRGLKELAKKLDLGRLFGTTPRDYTLTQAPYPSNNSLLSLFIEEASPFATSINNSRAAIPKLMISNTGAQRFDMYKGPFTENDRIISSPFSNGWVYIPNVRLSVATRLLTELNEAGEKKLGEHRRSTEEDELWAYGYVEGRFREWLEEMDRRGGQEKREAGNLTLGYVTPDSCPGVGDDTLHTPLPYHRVPAFISSRPPDVPADAPIDLVFVDYTQLQFLRTLNAVQSEKTYTPDDVKQYTSLRTNEVVKIYAQAKWN